MSTKVWIRELCPEIELVPFSLATFYPIEWQRHRLQDEMVLLVASAKGLESLKGKEIHSGPVVFQGPNGVEDARSLGLNVVYVGPGLGVEALLEEVPKDLKKCRWVQLGSQKTQASEGLFLRHGVEIDLIPTYGQRLVALSAEAKEDFGNSFYWLHFAGSGVENDRAQRDILNLKNEQRCHFCWGRTAFSRAELLREECHFLNPEDPPSVWVDQIKKRIL